MANAIKDSMKAKPTKEKDAPKEEKAPWETPEEGEQELAVFVAPDTSQYRRKLAEHELMAWLAAQVKHSDQSTEDMWKSVFAQVAEADTVEEILDGKVETVKGREILDTVLECNSIKFTKSTEKDGFPFFAILECRYGPSRQSETLSVGGVMVCAQLAMLHYRSVELPIDSPYRVSADTPGAIARETYPHYFKIKKKETPSGTMNYLTSSLR